MYEFIYFFTRFLASMVRFLANLFVLVIWIVVRLFPGFVSCRKFSL